MCPTLHRLLVLERDAWFGDRHPSLLRTWDRYSDALSSLLHRDDLEDYLLEEVK